MATHEVILSKVLIIIVALRPDCNSLQSASLTEEIVCLVMWLLSTD